MSSQMISMAAQFADAAGPLGLSARLAEPSAITLFAIGIAGVVVGRFLLGRN